MTDSTSLYQKCYRKLSTKEILVPDTTPDHQLFGFLFSGVVSNNWKKWTNKKKRWVTYIDF